MTMLLGMTSGAQHGQYSGLASSGREWEEWSPGTACLNPQESVRQLRLGDLTSSSGQQGNIEIVVYGKNSIFAKNQILKNSQDPLARSIAVQELLELMKVVEVPDSQSTGLGIGNMATQTANATGAGANVATS